MHPRTSGDDRTGTWVCQFSEATCSACGAQWPHGAAWHHMKRDGHSRSARTNHSNSCKHGCGHRAECHTYSSAHLLVRCPHRTLGCTPPALSHARLQLHGHICACHRKSSRAVAIAAWRGACQRPSVAGGRCCLLKQLQVGQRCRCRAGGSFTCGLRRGVSMLRCRLWRLPFAAFWRLSMCP